MGRQPCCDKVGLKRGPWTIEEDNKLMSFILNNGIQCWRLVPKLAGLMRCGKSCRLRWINYLRPDLKRGAWTEAEDDMIIELHSQLGNRWSKIAAHFPGRTDNEIKNHWNTKIKKKLRRLGLDPLTHKPINNQLVLDHHSFKNIEEIAEYCSSSVEEDTMKMEPQESSNLQMQNNEKKMVKQSSLEEESKILAGLFNEIKQYDQEQIRPCLDGSNYMGNNDVQFQLEDPFQNWINSPFPWDVFSSTFGDNFL